MKRIIFILLFILINFSYGKDIYWVFFTDKGVSGKEPELNHLRKTWCQTPINKNYLSIIKKQGYKIRIKSDYLNCISIELDKTQTIREIMQFDFVSNVRPVFTYKKKYNISKTTYNRKIQILDDYHIQINQIQGNLLHNEGFYGDNIKIGILDTGFELDHEALSNINVIGKYDFINNDTIVKNEPNEDNENQSSHGTKVLSIIAGDDSGKLQGIAPNCEFLLAKTEYANEEIIIEEDYFVAGLEWCARQGAQVITASLGYIDWYDYDDFDGKTTVSAKAVKSISETDDIVIIIAAGNEGNYQTGTLITPADADEAIAVGSIDGNGNISSFSSTGPTADGRIKPDVLARGEGTYFAVPYSENFIGTGNGTSYAAPLVAGACALIRQKNPQLTAPEIRNRIKETASQSESPDNQWGYGIMNAYAAAATEGLISGNIRSENHFPLNGVQVILDGYTTYTNQNGYFLVPVKLENDQILYLKHNGYQDKNIILNNYKINDFPLTIEMIPVERKNIIIYPNPAETFIEIKTLIPIQHLEIKIFRIDGTLCYSDNYSFNNREGIVRYTIKNNNKNINKSGKELNLISGIYLLYLKIDEEVETAKLLIK